MTTEEKQALLNELSTAKNSVFSDGGPHIPILQSIVYKLKSLSPQDKSFFKDFATELKNNLFESGANISGLDLADFEEKKQSPVAESKVEKPEAVSNGRGYFEALIELFDCLRDELKTSKNYFFLKLHSDSNTSYEPLLIYEPGCFYQPLRKRLQDKYTNYFCKSIDEIVEDINKGVFPETNFVAVLILSTKINEKEKIEARQNNLKLILEQFEEPHYLSPKSLEIKKQGDVISTNNIDLFLDEIKYVTSSFLTNAELSNEEEKIIKKLFQDSNCPILEYKVLKGGKSGSKVIEIRPKKDYATDLTKRFIVKFGPIDDKKKISEENRRFSEHIEYYSVPRYEKKFEANSMIEAIKYIYASGNSIKSSHSFADIITNPKNEFYSKGKDIIEEVFSSNPFELWKQSTETGKHKVADLYKDYIKSEKFFDNVKRIKGINNDTDIEKEEIYSNFGKIIDLEIGTKTKVCHGDFHTDNFFKDAYNTYLIDFGFTDKRHAIIDHTALECSIKFKHVPFYIDLKVLEEIEEQLLSSDSFNASFEIKTSRRDITHYYDLVRCVRTNSLSHVKDENSRFEYLVSLFIMTCRHAQYPDLNQLYALKSAEIIGKRLVQLGS